MTGPRLQQAPRIAQGQTLAMTPQLTQSIKLLAMTNLELEAYLDREVARNPLLRKLDPPSRSQPPRRLAGGTDERLDVWERIAAPQTLADHLQGQLAGGGLPSTACAVAKAIVHDLDEDGRLPDPGGLATTLGADATTFAAALTLVRSLDPAGVGARDLADCLGLQLSRRDRLDPAMAAILSRLDLVAAANRVALKAVSGLDDDDLDDALAEIRALDPRPGRRFETGGAAPAPPDILLDRDERGGWRIELNAETLPRILADREYRASIRPYLRSTAERDYIADAWETAAWLERAVDQRARTVLKVARAVVEAQDAFFENGIASLSPLTMRMVAERIGMHESTVSRVASGKTIEGPRGLTPLRRLFSTGLPASDGTAHSAVAVRERIRAIVAAEGPRILSDDAIASRLRGDGVEIARRTVAKYRETLAIPSSTHRRRMLGAGHVAAGTPM